MPDTAYQDNNEYTCVKMKLTWCLPKRLDHQQIQKKEACVHTKCICCMQSENLRSLQTAWG